MLTKNIYANKDEMQSLLELGAVLELLKGLRDSNKDIPEYSEPLGKAFKQAEAVKEKRYSYLDPKGKESISRRVGSGFVVSQIEANIATSRKCNITVNEAYLYDALEIITEEHCYRCTKSKGKCKIYSILLGMASPAVNPRVGKKECEYKI